MVTTGIQSILRGNIMDAIGRGAEYAGSWLTGTFFCQAHFVKR